MEAASLCFFRCVRFLDVLERGCARLDLYEDDSDSNSESHGHHVRLMVVGGHNNIYQCDTDLPGTDLGINSIMHIANRWMSDKDMSKVVVRVEELWWGRNFAKSFVYPRFSADIREFMLVSDVSVNPLHMRRDYRVPQLAVHIANFMNRISTLLDAQELLVLQGMRSAFEVISDGERVLRVSVRAYANASTGLMTVQYDMGGGSRTESRRSVTEIIREHYIPLYHNHIVFRCGRPRLNLYLKYEAPSYHCNQPYLAEILEPV